MELEPLPELPERDKRDLMVCTMCGIGIAMTDRMFSDGMAMSWHYGFDEKACGPIMAISAKEKKSDEP